MQIHIKLMGLLKDKTPAGGVLEIQDNTTIHDVLVQLDIAPEMIQVVSINNKFERDFSIPLQAEDEFMVLAPVGGG